MNARLFSALRACGDLGDNFLYFSREASMKKLAVKGFVESYKVPGCHKDAWRITPVGRAKLAELEGKK